MPKKSAVANFVFRPKRYNLVTDKMAAKRISKMLLNPRIRHRYFAIDTETVGCDPTFQSPCKMAYMISASIYCGPDVNFGNGPYIWIENINEHLIKYFQPFFADPTIKKVFHNYSYDYHVLRNCNIIVNGFAADTLHMARLLDSDRLRYSLEVLTTDYLKRPKIPFKKLFPVPETALKEIRDSDNGGTKLDEDIESIDKDLIPEPFLLQINKKNRMKWIDYCVYDTEATWLLREKFESLLLKQHWGVCSTMYDLYKKVYVPFARLLVRMEERGFHIDVKGALSDSFENAFSIASKYADKFKKWAVKYEPNSENLNPRSYRQVQQLLFAPNSETDLHETKLKHDHIFNIENENNVILPGKKTPNKYLKVRIRGMGIKPVSRTATNRPQCNIEVIEKLAGTPYDRYPYYGIAIKHFADRKEGIKACKALYELCNLYKSEKLLNTYLETLGNHIDEDGRIHCAMNLNTNTGRISARSPNLQNQPSADRDEYRIRKAFNTTKGKKLIVADYSQLELRVLAHVSNCKSMIEAFKLGGDFHSRTAMQMFPYIKKEVEEGKVVVDDRGTKAPVPTIKTTFASERHRAKTFNFSIVYGKTSHGFAKDFGMTNEQALSYLKKWYKERPEVKEWQEEMLASARRNGFVKTLIGRKRRMKDIKSRLAKRRAHAERTAINTPIQGGAADIVMMAMLKIDEDIVLRQMGWHLILQIHDEVILEGPEESAYDALKIVRRHLENPFGQKFRVDFVVSIAVGDNWQDAK